VIVTASFQPIADAGADKQAVKGEEVTLDGSGSLDPVTCTNEDSLSYSWEFTTDPSGGADTLDLTDPARPSFTPNFIGDYVLKLTVTFETKTGEDTVTVTVSEEALTIGDLESGDYELTLDSVVDNVFGLLGNFLGQGDMLEDRLTLSDPEPGGGTSSHSLPVNIVGKDDVTGNLNLDLTWESDQDESYTVGGAASLAFTVSLPDPWGDVTCTSGAALGGDVNPTSDNAFAMSLIFSSVTLSANCQIACTLQIIPCEFGNTIEFDILGGDPQ